MKKVNWTVIILILTLLASLVLFIHEQNCLAASSESDWTMYNHDPQHTGFSQSSVPESPNVIWTFPDPNITNVPIDYTFITSTPVASKGLLYISGAKGGGFYALNASTGDLIWSDPDIFVAASTATPAVDNDRIYVGVNGLITALNASTGTQIWKANLPGQGGSPTVVDGIVYVQGYRALYALNASTGARVWEYPNQGSFATSLVPAIAEGYVYAATLGKDSSSGYIYALNAFTGEEVWRYNAETSAQSSPVVEDGKVFIGSNENIYALNAQTGTLIWKYTTGLAVTGSPATAYDTVYVGSWDTDIYALNSSTGDKLWNYSTGAGIHSSPAIADGTVYVSSDDRYLYALNASTGELIWKYLTISPQDHYATYGNMLASPAIANGNIYIGTNEGNVIAFGNKSTTISPLYSTDIIVVFIIVIAVLIGAILLVYLERHRHN